MRLTEFFRLRMPDGTDPVNIEDFNDNFEVIDRELKKRISDDGSASDVTVGFEVAESRQPLKSGEKLSVLMGKAHRFFTDLKTVAFSGKYGDLIERPTLGGAAGYKVADNDTTNSSEFLSTARVAYEHGQEIDALSRDLHTLNYKDLGSGGTAAMALSQSISHVCFHHIAMDSCGRGRFQCADGWFDYDIIRSADDYCSGFVSGHTKSEAYQFYRE